MAVTSWSWRTTLGVLAAVFLLIGLAAWGISVAIEQARQAAAREKEERVAQAFEQSRGFASVQVFRDAELIPLLANDAKSAARLTDLNLSMIDMRDCDVSAAKQLTNVKRVYFYSTHGTDKLLKALEHSPAIETLGFEEADLTDDGIQSLATFPNLKEVRFEQVVDQPREDRIRKLLPGVEVEVPYPEANEPR